MNLDYKKFERLCALNGKATSTVAEAAGISKNLPGRWKNGTAKASNASIKKLANYFGVSIDELIIDDCTILNATTNVSNSVVMHANNNEHVSMSTQAASSCEELSEQEAEMLRIFRALDMRQKNTAMTYLYNLEDQSKNYNPN